MGLKKKNTFLMCLQNNVNISQGPYNYSVAMEIPNIVYFWVLSSRGKQFSDGKDLKSNGKKLTHQLIS